MRRYLPVLFLLLSTIASAQKKVEPLVKVRTVSSKFQFVSNKTQLPADQQLWDEVDPFSSGFSRVFLNNKFSFVNISGKPISPVVFEDARNFSNHLAAVKKDGKWGFISETGKTVLPNNYDIVFDFDGNVTAVYNKKQWWLVSNTGEILKALDISVCFGFKNGVAKVTKDDKEGILYPDGKIVLSPVKKKVDNSIPYHRNSNSNSNSLVAQCPDNIDFEYGDFTNWQCYIGRVDSVGNTNVITVNPSPPTPNRHTIISRALPSAIDPFGLFPLNPPDGSNFAVKLGNTNVGAEAERIAYAIHIPLNDSNFSIKYNYAVVLQDPGHTMWTQPRFNAQLRDSATGNYIDCASFEYISTSGLPGFSVSPVNPGVIYKPWSSVFYSLRGYAGRTIYLEFTTADCVRRAHWGYAYVDVESTCGSPVEVHYDCTYPNATTLTAPPGFQFYNWWDQTFTTLLGTGQQLYMNPGPSINSIIWLEMIPYNNFGCTDTLMININGDFDAEFDMSADNGCSPQTFTFYNRNLPSLTTLWDFGDGTTGTGDTVTHTYSIPGTYNVTLDVTVPGGCNGTALHPITIYPTPDVVQPPNQTLCAGSATNDINFSGTPSNTVFNWTNDNPSIGLAASGTGDILSFTTINSGNSSVTATITVTPMHLTCAGTPKTFTITVNPTPDVVQPANQTICNGSATSAVNFSGSLTGTIFSWTNSNTSIGLAASGTGNIAAFTATNLSGVPVTATISVTPATPDCSGTPRSFTITVNPVPGVVQPFNQTLCNGATTTSIVFTGTVAGATYNWVNNNTSIGLAGSGNGNIAAFTATNTGNSPVTATITVTPSFGGCPGTPKTFTITVQPDPKIYQPLNQVLCNTEMANATTFTGPYSGTVYNWVNNNTSIGLAANGTGDIPAFTATCTGNVQAVATITVTPSIGACVGSPKTFTIIVKPTPDVLQPANQTLCNAVLTNAIAFSGSVSGTVYNWTNDNPSIGLAANGTGNIPAFTAVNTGTTPIMATVTVTPVASNCPGSSKSFTITVNPTPDVVRPSNQTLCNISTTNAVSFTGTVNNTTYNWVNNNTSIGLAGSGNGNIPAFTAVNTGTTPVTATITVTPSAAGCPGNPETFTITVNPTPNVVQPANQNLCNGATTNTIALTGAVANTVYNWTNNNTSIGLAASGNGNIPAFTAINTGNSPVTATISVTPSAAGCPGTPVIFTITVNPTPDVVQPQNQALCGGNNTNAITFTGSVNNTVYNWTNSETSIGLASSGTGNIPAFTAVNTGSSPVTATITVTPSAAGCPGIPETFTITVNPEPSVVQPSNQNLCNGVTTNTIIFTGSVNNTVYDWTNNNPSIGLAGSGTGNIPAFTAVNTGSTPVTATITVTPTASGCTGPPVTFTITVNPVPNVIQPANQALCSGNTTNTILFTGSVNNTTYNWTNSEPSIGLAASGTGNIQGFTAVNSGNTSITATITVTPSVGGGCNGNPEIFTITVNPTPDVAPPSDQSLCNKATTNAISFTGSLAGATYDWTNNNPSIGLAANGTGDIPAFMAINTSNAPVTATITVTPTFGSCSGLAKTFKITVNPTPLVQASNSANVCLGKSVQLNATGAVDYYWDPAGWLSCTNCADPVATPTDNIRYTVRGVSTFGCEASDSILLTVIKPFQMFITPDDTLCIGESTNLTASGANSYIWSPSQGLNRTDIANPTARPNTTTLYRVVGYDGHNCFTDTSFVKITVGPKPIVNIGPDINLSTGSVVTLHPVTQNGPIVNWSWSPAAGLSCADCPSPVLTVTDNTYYTLTVTNNFGCTGSDIISIFTFCKSAQVFIPNAFTPDGDGLNDILMVRGKGIFVKNFRIFNRWGELVFEKNNFNPNDPKYGWDGKVRGIAATPDVFVYTAEVICDNGIIYTYKGNTTLLK